MSSPEERRNEGEPASGTEGGAPENKKDNPFVLFRWARRLFVLPIRLYQLAISPLLPSSCIYTPTCSHYGLHAVLTHGIFRGTLMGIFRILRCNALFLGGEDPVPERFSWKGVFRSYREHSRLRK